MKYKAGDKVLIKHNNVWVKGILKCDAEASTNNMLPDYEVGDTIYLKNLYREVKQFKFVEYSTDKRCILFERDSGAKDQCSVSYIVPLSDVLVDVCKTVPVTYSDHAQAKASGWFAQQEGRAFRTETPALFVSDLEDKDNIKPETAYFKVIKTAEEFPPVGSILKGEKHADRWRLYDNLYIQGGFWGFNDQGETFLRAETDPKVERMPDNFTPEGEPNERGYWEPKKYKYCKISRIVKDKETVSPIDTEGRVFRIEGQDTCNRFYVLKPSRTILIGASCAYLNCDGWELMPEGWEPKEFNEELGYSDELVPKPYYRYFKCVVTSNFHPDYNKVGRVYRCKARSAWLYLDKLIDANITVGMNGVAYFVELSPSGVQGLVFNDKDFTE